MTANSLEATWDSFLGRRAVEIEIQTRERKIDRETGADERKKEDGDAACMRRLGAGEEAALVEIVDRWYTPLMNFFYRSTGSRHDAEDLTQSVLLKLYRAAPRYREEAKFSTFLFVIARRVLHNHRRFFFRRVHGLIDYAKVPETLLADPDDGRSREIEEFFQNTMAKLPERQRTALLLRKQQGMSYREIAEAMNANEGRVKTWIFRARQTMKEAYDREMDA